jgi:hypothetical protein
MMDLAHLTLHYNIYTSNTGFGLGFPIWYLPSNHVFLFPLSLPISTERRQLHVHTSQPTLHLGHSLHLTAIAPRFAMPVSLGVILAYPSLLPCPQLLTPSTSTTVTFGRPLFQVSMVTGTIWSSYLDGFSYFLYTFPLRLKSDTFPTLQHFFTYLHSVSSLVHAL